MATKVPARALRARAAAPPGRQPLAGALGRVGARPRQQRRHERQRLPAHELVRVAQARGQARRVRVHKRGERDHQVRQRHHDVVAHLRARARAGLTRFPRGRAPARRAPARRCTSMRAPACA